MGSELKKSSSIKKSGGTPIKMLIAREMLKEADSKRKPPGVVARLMGLDDTMPSQQVDLTAKRSLQDGYPRSKSVGSLRGRRQQDDYYDRSMSCDIHSSFDEREFKDVYEVWQQPSRTDRTKYQSLQKGRSNGNYNEKRMDLVRQKFMEAKRLATDEKLLQSKEFHDALEVLSSNRDLFVKFLEEPNSLFLKQIKELHMAPSKPQTKRITLLKPSKTAEANDEKHVKKQHQVAYGSEWDLNKPRRGSNLSNSRPENLSQPTRIVVLKPSPAKSLHIKPTATMPLSSSRLLQQGNYCKGLETGEAIESRDIAKDVTQQMWENVNNHRRDESLLSSALSNGYVGDDSSFNKSESEYIEDVCSFSDSEMVSPTSRHSWDFNNRFDSPYSLSSFSRTSYSPDSSVIREAKKRLSERWALVASNGTSQEQMQVQRGSSTLGEMLSIPLEKTEGSNGISTLPSSSSYGGEDDLKAAATCLPTDSAKDGDSGESSPNRLPRSKSLPISSSAFDNFVLDTEASDTKISKTIDIKEVGKSKRGISSLKGKVSNFFFPKSKKSGKQKTNCSPLIVKDNRPQSDTLCKNNDEASKSVHDGSAEENYLTNLEEESCKFPSATSENNGPKMSPLVGKAAITLEKPVTSENLIENKDKLKTYKNPNENQDQPSPTSVLDAPFEEEESTNVTSESVANTGNNQALFRSEPIETITRSLSTEDTHLGTSLLNPLKLSVEEEEEEGFMFVKKLLSSAGVDDEKVDMVFTRWHSPDSPLDPTLLGRLLDGKEGSKSRDRGSSQRLLFDCVNAALLDIGRDSELRAYPGATVCGEACKDDQAAGTTVGAEVRSRVRDWLSGNRASCETGNSGLAVDSLLRKEVSGRGWAEYMRSEKDEVCKEIGGNVLEDLVGEVSVELAY